MRCRVSGNLKVLGNGLKAWRKAGYHSNDRMKTSSSTKSKPIPSSLIAPCGMNCRLCRAYIREKNACQGCRDDGQLKPKTRTYCRIKQCEVLKAADLRYCFACGKYPCDRLNRLDTRYRTKYGMSMIDNLNDIKHVGIRNFIKQEMGRWTCPTCGNIICVHEERCIICNYKWR